VRRFLVGFCRFWYEFLVGDDWKIAVAVATILAIGGVVLVVFRPEEALFTWVLGLALIAAFAIAVRIDIRSR
jgi:hypothetical protein